MGFARFAPGSAITYRTKHMSSLAFSKKCIQTNICGGIYDCPQKFATKGFLLIWAVIGVYYAILNVLYKFRGFFMFLFALTLKDYLLTILLNRMSI